MLQDDDEKCALLQRRFHSVKEEVLVTPGHVFEEVHLYGTFVHSCIFLQVIFMHANFWALKIFATG